MKRKGPHQPTRREAQTALEAVMWTLLVWRGSWDSAVEDYCYQEVRRLADESFKRMGAQNMLVLQQAVYNILRERCGDDVVAGVPSTARQESAVPGEPVEGQAVGVPQSRGSGLEGGAEAAVGLRAVVDGPDLEPEG